MKESIRQTINKAAELKRRIDDNDDNATYLNEEAADFVSYYLPRLTERLEFLEKIVEEADLRPDT